MKEIVFAILTVALMSCSGFPVPGKMSDKKMLELYDRANSGDSIAQFQIFESHSFSREIRLQAFEMSLESGYWRAVNYKINEAAAAKNWNEYRKWFHYGVEKKSVYHMRKLAIAHLTGENFKKDTLRAIELFQMAIELHDAESRWRLRKIKGEEVHALVDFYEEMRDHFYATKEGTVPARIIIASKGLRPAIMRTGFGFESFWLNLAAGILTPLAFIFLFAFCFFLYHGLESRFVAFEINPSAASIYCVFLGVYGALFWRSEGIESLGTLSVAGSGFISWLTVLLTLAFWVLLIYGIVVIFKSSTGILTAALRLTLLPAFCVFGFMAGVIGIVFVILGFAIIGGIFGGSGSSKSKKEKAQWESGAEDENPPIIIDGDGVEWKRGVGNVYHREGSFLGSGSKYKNEI